MKKKLLSVLLSAAMVLTLAGCGSGTETAATEEAAGAVEETTEASGTEADAAEGSKVLKVAMECGYAPGRSLMMQTEPFRSTTALIMLMDMML